MRILVFKQELNKIQHSVNRQYFILCKSITKMQYTCIRNHIQYTPGDPSNSHLHVAMEFWCLKILQTIDDRWK